jgi:hypothetical protein
VHRLGSEGAGRDEEPRPHAVDAELVAREEPAVVGVDPERVARADGQRAVPPADDEDVLLFHDDRLGQVDQRAGGRLLR